MALTLKISNELVKIQGLNKSAANSYRVGLWKNLPFRTGYRYAIVPEWSRAWLQVCGSQLGKNGPSLKSLGLFEEPGDPDKNHRADEGYDDGADKASARPDVE